MVRGTNISERAGMKLASPSPGPIVPGPRGLVWLESWRMQKAQETWIQSLGREDSLEEKMATCSSILVWKIPRTEELGRLQSMGSQSRT